MNGALTVLVPWIDALGRSLVHFLWQGALIGALYFLLRPLCTSMTVRYRLGMGALFAMFAAPVATLLWLNPGASSQDDVLTAAVSSAATRIEAVATVTAAVSSWRWEQLLPWLVALWLFGVCAIATRSFLHWRRLARIVSEAVELPRDWQLNLIQLRQRFGVLRPVRLLASVRVHSPMLIGWFKPAILLPASLLTGFTPAQIELIIAHELSHVRRFDYIANLAQIAIETLLFYHPLVHWISRDVRQAREQCCDDLVLTVGGGNAIAYARTLADLEELQHDYGTAVPALGIGGGELLTRIQRIVDPAHTVALDPLPRTSGALLPMLAACAGFALFALRLHLMPAQVANAIAQLPAQSAAVVSGNAALASLHDAPTSVPARPLAREQQSVAVAAAPVLVEGAPRPRIALAAPPRLGRIANAPTRVEFIAPPLHVAEVTAVQPSTVAAVKPSVPTETASIAMPTPEQVVPARYPQDALLSGATGKVDLDFRITADGHVRDVRVLHATPAGVFDQAAIAALRQWRFAATGMETDTRYTRSFAFAHEPSRDSCREVTGSHICRRSDSDNN
jgi:TonB family protein